MDRGAEDRKAVAVVFHSVCGNTWQLAVRLAEALEALGTPVLLRRLPDPNYAVTCDAFPASREFKDGITAVPLLQSPAELLGCRGLLLGSPTYFGNVSAPVKSFMDSFVDYWEGAPMAGKPFGCFTSSGTAQGGADLCLKAMQTFAMHIGMLCVPVPSTAGGSPQPAYGLAHFSGDLAEDRLTAAEAESIKGYAGFFAGML